MLLPMLGLLAGCQTTTDVGRPSGRRSIHQEAMAALDQIRARDPSLEPLINSAYAYVIFPEIVTVAVGVGGASGTGEVYQQGQLIGYADLTQASVGAQVGGQKYAELILFRTEQPFLDFRQGSFEFDARASAVAASSGAAAAADYSRGVLVETLPQSGLMVQAALGVQKFQFTPIAATR